MAKNMNIVRIPTSLSSNFFRFWFEFLEPFHHLTGREIDIITSFLRQRYFLSKVIKDDTILDNVLMGEDTRRKIREECDITLPHFQVIMSKLKKAGIIKDGKINKKYIPNIEEDAGEFRLIFHFEIKKDDI